MSKNKLTLNSTEIEAKNPANSDQGGQVEETLPKKEEVEETTSKEEIVVKDKDVVSVGEKLKKEIDRLDSEIDKLKFKKSELEGKFLKIEAEIEKQKKKYSNQENISAYLKTQQKLREQRAGIVVRETEIKRSPLDASLTANNKRPAQNSLVKKKQE